MDLTLNQAALYGATDELLSLTGAAGNEGEHPAGWQQATVNRFTSALSLPHVPVTVADVLPGLDSDTDHSSSAVYNPEERDLKTGRRVSELSLLHEVAHHAVLGSVFARVGMEMPEYGESTSSLVQKMSPHQMMRFSLLFSQADEDNGHGPVFVAKNLELMEKFEGPKVANTFSVLLAKWKGALKNGYLPTPTPASAPYLNPSA